MRRLVPITIAAIILSLILPGCTKKAELSSNRLAMVRIINASPTMPNINVNFDKAVAAPGLASSVATDYISFPGRSYNVQVFEVGGSDEPILKERMELRPGTYYTLFIAGNAQRPYMNMVTDDMRRPAKNKARMRFVNMSPDSLFLDLSLRNEKKPLIRDVAFGKASKYIDVKPGTFDYILHPAGLDTQAANTNGVTTQAGIVYSIVAEGSLGGNTLDLHLYMDRHP